MGDASDAQAFCDGRHRQWTLSPAYDLLYTETQIGGHWMFINGQTQRINRDDLNAIADRHSIVVGSIVEEVIAGVTQFPKLAKQLKIDSGLSHVIESIIRNNIKNLDMKRKQVDLKFI